MTLPCPRECGPTPLLGTVPEPPSTDNFHLPHIPQNWYNHPMTSQVLYRKWRPRRFSDLAGQEHVTTVLRQAVLQDRISHAYLFCGPRGTGKTTTARVLARTLSCLSPQDGEPDNACSLCQNIDAGRAMDLIEMDAASNRGIDEIRSIRDRVNFSPVESKYKVYIVDEAHMLTEAASNAFLKTLEEPPPHVIFVLCTTEPHKILPTIISRCQRFDFRRISTETIVERLRFICEQEGIEADSAVLGALARAAGGSLRDAENLLEQVVVSFGQNPDINSLQDMLGLSHSREAQALVAHFLLGNTPGALGVIGKAASEGVDLRQVHRQSVELLRAVLLIKSGAADTLDLGEETLNEMAALARKVQLPTVMRCLKALGEINMRLDSTSSLPLELAVVETSLAQEAQTSMPAAPTRTALAAVRDNRRPYSTDRQTSPSQPRPQRQPTRPTQPAPADAPAPTPVAQVDGEPIAPAIWDQIVRSLRRQKGKRFFLGALLNDCRSPHLENGSVVLPFRYPSNLERMEGELREAEGNAAIKNAINHYLGKPYEVRLTLLDNATNRPAAVSSPLVRAARQMGGRILDERNIEP